LLRAKQWDADEIGIRAFPDIISPMAPRSIENRIVEIRGQKVMLDRDLAEVYGVTTKHLNQQVRRNSSRFPLDLAFRLSPDEIKEVVTNCDHLSNLKFSKALPLAFTEYGALMAANVLKSDRAIEMSLFVIRAFVKMRLLLTERGEFARRLDRIERKLLRHDTAFHEIHREITALRQETEAGNRPRIGFRSDDQSV